MCQFLATDIRNIMNGNVMKVPSRVFLNEVIEELEKENHNGIVITGSNPWFVSVVKKTTSIHFFKAGRFYKFLGKGSNNKVFEVIDIDSGKMRYRYLEPFTNSCNSENMKIQDYVEVIQVWTEVKSQWFHLLG